MTQFEYALLALNATVKRYVQGQELFSDLAQGRIDCQESTLSYAKTHMIYNYHRYLVMTRHVLEFRPLVMNKQFYQKAP